MPLAKSFTNVVAMGLKHLNCIYFIHFIDLFTRFSKARVIKRKTPEVVVKAFITEWISNGFGAPNKVLVDNGSEFDNPEYLDAMAQYNVEVMATAASSPWSNGICERNHAVVDIVVQKILEEQPAIDIEMALANAVSAKNCLMNNKGFTPVQLVTGQLPNLPTVFNSSLPSLESPESKNNMLYISNEHSKTGIY